MITNAKKKLIGSDSHVLGGSDTHSAGISGSNVMGDQQDIANRGTFSGDEGGFPALNTSDKLIDSITITPTNAKNRVILIQHVYKNSNFPHPDLTIERSTGGVLGTISPSGFDAFQVVILDDETAVSHTYESWIRSDTGINNFNADHHTFLAFVVTSNDTHAGVLNGSDTHVLSGSNTQKTRSQEAIQ